eukprot:CAMPEP_0118722110 /NCGR_PEP_ID=MMETSP0800-20121206/31161_1 /TAXON_ID=210618 ORGANISM="Striatella unipunctata, Strain CCMP2910" /NCGR_SAMPLE_ID=MMETSP0800 /ASSEMBLY_ACC=CAM_ASM_000638 /LENGTH=750 /DNA_ID=CAMNT_0006630179 /DNA_START=311 /DNA_END=2563 /DNA_ORIENTATION=-
MASGDWAQIDVSGTILPSAAVPSDLFGGELFGDELIDIYNSTVVTGGDGTAESVEIPSLLRISEGGEVISQSRTEGDGSAQSDQDAQVAMAAAGLDDGLGAFSPSTSFNDLAHLLPGGGNHEIDDMETMEFLESRSVPGETDGDAMASPEDPTKKRCRDQSDPNSPQAKAGDGPSRKKRATTPKNTTARRVSGAATSRQPVGAKSGKLPVVDTVTSAVVPPVEHVLQSTVTTLQNRDQFIPTANDENNTPDPLSISSMQQVIPTVETKTSGVVVTPKPGNIKIPTSVPDNLKSRPHNPATTVQPVAVISSGNARTSSTAGKPNAAPTEADFKSVAQAAVNNLILSVGGGTGRKSPAPPPKTNPVVKSNNKVDTSTEHVTALTSSNWVNVCTENAETGDSSNTAAEGDIKATSRVKRQNLTPDERARQNRDRNREHARNTRLRKKAYVEELKRTLTELVAQRDAAELEKRHTAQRELEQREVRFRVMEEFLKLRGRNETNFSRWIAILEDGFTMTTSLVDFGKADKTNEDSLNKCTSGEQILTGATEAMAESTHFSSSLDLLSAQFRSTFDGYKTGAPGSGLSLKYTCDRKDFIMDGCQALLNWVASSESEGQQPELSFKGMMRAVFSPASNKLASIIMSYDTGHVVKQLRGIAPCAYTVSVPIADQTCDPVAAAAAAAQAVEARAILDSLEVPRIPVSVPSAISVGVSTSAVASVTSSEKSDCSSDELEEGNSDVKTDKLANRRDVSNCA